MARKKSNSSKVNLTISAVFHTVLIVGIFYLAAREGMLGKRLKELTVVTQPKEEKKQPEQAKQKPVEPPKQEAPKQVEAAKAATAPPPVAQASEPPPSVSVPTAAPAAVNLPDMDFDTGAKPTVDADPKTVYKGLVELAFRTHWNRPEDIDDTSFVAEVEVGIDNQGKIANTRFVKSSGNARWDGSVKAAVAATKVVTRPPPKGFPQTVLVRFDIQTEESALQLSSR